jgi:competence protein ComEA
MRFRDGARSGASAEAEAAASAARLTRVVGPEPGVYRLEPPDGLPGGDPVWPVGGDPLSLAGGSPAVGAGRDVDGVGEGGPGGGSGAGARAGGADPAAVRRALAALDPGRRAVRTLAVVALVVAIVVGFLVWRSRPRAEPVPAVAASAVAAPSASPATIVVSVLGRVQRPGLVRLPHGARVADAIEAAGGVLPGTDLGYLNLARKVVDGELLAIGIGPAPSAPGAGAPGGSGGPPGLINLNTATVAELDTLPGVGPVLAQRIVDHRNRTGGFKSVEELRKVEGVGDARFEQIKDLVTV